MSSPSPHKSNMSIAVTRTLADTVNDVLLFDNDLDGLPSALLTIPEVAKFLRISASGVRRLQEQRSIPFIKVGGSVRFLKEDLFSYLRKQRVETVE